MDEKQIKYHQINKVVQINKCTRVYTTILNYLQLTFCSLGNAILYFSIHNLLIAIHFFLAKMIVTYRKIENNNAKDRKRKCCLPT